MGFCNTATFIDKQKTTSLLNLTACQWKILRKMINQLKSKYHYINLQHTSDRVSVFTCFSHLMPRKNSSPPENCLPKQTLIVTSESSTWKPTKIKWLRFCSPKNATISILKMWNTKKYIYMPDNTKHIKFIPKKTKGVGISICCVCVCVCCGWKSITKTKGKKYGLIQQKVIHLHFAVKSNRHLDKARCQPTQMIFPC